MWMKFERVPTGAQRSKNVLTDRGGWLVMYFVFYCTLFAVTNHVRCSQLDSRGISSVKSIPRWALPSPPGPTLTPFSRNILAPERALWNFIFSMYLKVFIWGKISWQWSVLFIRFEFEILFKKSKRGITSTNLFNFSFVLYFHSILEKYIST